MKGLLSFLFVAVFAVSASAQWSFVKYFPDASKTFSVNGINNGLVVDKAGKIWLQTQTTADSIDLGGGVMKYFSEIFVYYPDGSQAAFSPIKFYSNGSDIQDTLGTSGYGLTLDPDGNVISCDPSTRLYRLNAQTGAAMAKVISPISGYTSSMVCPATDAAGEVFVGPVLPGGGIAILNPDFSSAGTTIEASTIDYARAIAVTPDGNDVYFPYFGIQKTVHYHSDNGSLGPYAAADTVLVGLCVETTVWDKDGLLWVTGGNAVSGIPQDPKYTGYTFYGWNPTSKAITDSINWYHPSGNYDTLKRIDPRPRGIAFNARGDTAYVATFNANDSCVEVFHNPTKVGVRAEQGVVATSYELSQNYPNPFNPTTEISFSIAKAGYTTLKVYDILGKEVATLHNGDLNAGTYRATFDASNLASGTYLYVLRSGSQVLTHKMMLLK